MIGRILSAISLVTFIAGCCAHGRAPDSDSGAKVLNIRWQRLVTETGETCERCGLTEKDVQKAFHDLKRALAPLHIEVTLETIPLDPATAAEDISQSNRIWIGERPLEDWLGAEVGMSPCAGCREELCEDVECRTVKVGAATYEAIPAELIIKAGLIAASELIEAPGTGQCGPECCPAKEESPK
ncbi:MAG: DUF2703 domain-containing protein [Planctomycetota bacterium]|nr:DUF2703 domain-containing protein [Planctomycetota bacterium]